jgi:N6-adenosine-specific RNA methylase IME4
MKRGKGTAERHYPTMTIGEICALPVGELAAKDCALFVWTTFPQLAEALRVIDAWGFAYKTVAFLWLKQNRIAKTWFYGMGFWTRSNAEVCLLATRGRPVRTNKGIHQFIIAPVEAHSKKPDQVRDLIASLIGDVKRIELFARSHTEGWDVWGDEVEGDVVLTPGKGGVRYSKRKE